MVSPTLTPNFTAALPLTTETIKLPVLPKQGNHFADRTLTKSINHSIDLDTVQTHIDIFFLLQCFTKVFDPNIRGNVAKVIDVNYLSTPTGFLSVQA